MAKPNRAARNIGGRPLADILGKWSRTEIEARFCAKVNREGPIPPHRPEIGRCHIWTGDKATAGYGLLLALTPALVITLAFLGYHAVR